MNMKKMEVEIFGEKIFLLSTEDDSYLKTLSEYVDKKMIEIFKLRKFYGEKSVINAMLLGLNIADELFKERKKNPETAKSANAENQKGKNTRVEELENELKRVKSRALKAEDDNKKLRYNLDKKTKELDALRKEFNEYIETFEKDGKGK